MAPPWIHRNEIDMAWNGMSTRPALHLISTAEEHTPRRSLSHSPGEEERTLIAVHERMGHLRHAEDAARRAGYAFRRALREVSVCRQALAEAATRLQQFPTPGRSVTSGSV